MFFFPCRRPGPIGYHPGHSDAATALGPEDGRAAQHAGAPPAGGDGTILRCLWTGDGRQARQAGGATMLPYCTRQVTSYLE